MTDENKPMPPNISEVDILKELATLDPLDDRAFRILASDDEQFKVLAESFSGETLDGEKIIHMNGEIVLTANGRLIRTDVLRDTDVALFNLEGQIKTADFPLKRHIFYTAVIYASSLQKSDQWEKLKPVISIVIYKDKGDAALIEKGTFSGDLFKTDDDCKQQTLIAVNTAKWKDAPTDELRAYLATLHHGIMTEDNKDEFTIVDVTNETFVKIQQAVKIACAHTKRQEYDDRGDDSMSAVLDQYISKEAKDAAKEEGLEEGLDIAQKIIRLLKENVPVAEIASKFKVSTKQVEMLRGAL